MRYPLALVLSLMLPVAASGVAGADEVLVNRGKDATISLTVNGSTITIRGHADSNETPIVGNGTLAREQRPIEAVSEVSLEGGFAAAIDIGSAPSLILEGDENILPAIRTELAGEKLRIYADHSYRAEQPVKVTLSLPSLVRLGAEGSNSASVRGIAAPELAISMSGSNTLALSGHAEALTVTLSGSGQLTAAALEADRVTMRISGAGSGAVTARSKLTAEIDGSGAIDVHGRPPKRAVRVNGSGSVRYVE